MKVALLIGAIPPYRVPLFEKLTKLIGAVRIFISTKAEPNRNWDLDFGTLEIEYLKSIMIPYQWKHPIGFTETLYLHFPYYLIGQLAHYHPDVIVSVEMGFRTIQALIYKFLHPNVKVVLWAAISEYTEEGRSNFRMMLRKFILANVDSVIVNGGGGYRYIKKFGYRNERITRVPYTTDFQKFKFSPIIQNGPEAQWKFLYVGRFEERKGIIPFIKTLKDFCAENNQYIIELTLAGYGPLLGELSNISLPVNLQLKILGPISYYDLPIVYRNCDIVAFPTLADEWGMVVSEAMAVGRPVLGSIYSQAVEELVINGINGWTFKPDDGEDTLAKIRQIICLSKDDLTIIGQRARESVEQHTPEYAAHQMVEAIKIACS